MIIAQSFLSCKTSLDNIVLNKSERCFASMKKVAVLMGSDSDFTIVSEAIIQLKAFDIPFEARVISAHRTPYEAERFAKNARNDGFGVIIAAAGKAAHLAGVLAAYTTLPVIGLPIKSSTMDGLDSLLSIVQMPAGVPVATVAIGGAQNAAILAAQILAISDETLAARLGAFKSDMADSIKARDLKLQSKISEL